MVGRELTMLAVRSEVLAMRARNEPHHKDFEELADTARRAHLMLNEIIVRRADERTATPGIDGLQRSPRRAAARAPRSASTSSRRPPAVPAASGGGLPGGPGVPDQLGQARPGRAGLGDDPARRGRPRRHRAESAARLGPVKAPVSTGTGTFSMRERVESMGGSLTTTRTDTTYEVRPRSRRRSGAGRVQARGPGGAAGPRDGRRPRIGGRARGRRAAARACGAACPSGRVR